MPSPAAFDATDLECAFAAASPRRAPRPTPWPSLVIHGGAALLFVLLATRAFAASNLVAWSAGFAYLLYDTALIAIVFRQTLPLLRPTAPVVPRGERPTLGVIVAAYDEAAVLPVTLRALLEQRDPPEVVLIADDGSRDATPDALAAFGLAIPALDAVSVSTTHPSLRWLRLPHGGKARALNAALLVVETELVVTVDGDTLLDRGACGALRATFATDPRLVAATGVMTPLCGLGPAAHLLESFQTYEYIRNFLGRYAWASMDALLLVSGAFAGFRRDAVLAVGGFDPACMVEDYELIHRLLRYGAQKRLGWVTHVVGGARAVTEAPSTVPAFLRQRRRWFCGFLQTQFWYRDMVGNRSYGRLGLAMLPIKALDTLQPLYGLFAVALLAAFLLTGRAPLLVPASGAYAGKIALDYAFHLWSVRLYRRWVDPDTKARLGKALLYALAEPFTFQVLRHLGAALGWVAFLTRYRAWGRQTRSALVAPGIRATDERGAI